MVEELMSVFSNAPAQATTTSSVTESPQRAVETKISTVAARSKEPTPTSEQPSG